jgi:hypothetical protein
VLHGTSGNIDELTLLEKDKEVEKGKCCSSGVNAHLKNIRI